MIDQTTALTLLKSYSCLEPRIPEDGAERETLRAAIAWICGESERENVGICAADQATAERTLSQYLAALGYGEPINVNPQTVTGPVYLKCNTESLRFYVETYDGDYRGVLLACQGEDENLCGTYGYFPLDLFANPE